jgi:hypothetical protein
MFWKGQTFRRHGEDTQSTFLSLDLPMELCQYLRSNTISFKTTYSWFVPPCQGCLSGSLLSQVQFARANALAAYKAKTIEDIAAVGYIAIVLRTNADMSKAAKIVNHIHHEMGLHIDYCKDFGVTKEEIERTEESQGEVASLRSRMQLTTILACTAYTRYLSYHKFTYTRY